MTRFKIKLHIKCANRPHSGTKSIPARTAQTLTYRGVDHDGLAAPAAAAPALMCYRGVRYGSETAPSESGAFAALLAA